MPPALHLSTILTRHPSKLLSHIRNVAEKYAGKGHTVLFALSSNFKEPEDLQAVVDKLSKFNQTDASERDGTPEEKRKIKGHTIGCLSDSFSSTKFEILPISKPPNDDLLSCSIGIFDSSHCIPFHSTLPGRTQPQVGRWHSFRKKNAQNTASAAEESPEPDWQNLNGNKIGEDKKGAIDWEAIWNRSSTPSTSSLTELLPEALRQIKFSQIQALFNFSAPHPDAFTGVLSTVLSPAPSLTLIAAPTHFVTGRPVTLFMDGQILDEGAVGLALLDVDGVKAEKVTCTTDFLHLKPISGLMKVTSREGNMINELNRTNPTKLLLDSLKDSPRAALISPNSLLSLATNFKGDEQFALGTVGPDGEMLRAYKITAGDPSSRGGSLSLDTPMAPPVGSVVQFLQVRSNLPVEIPLSILPALHQGDTHKQILACVTVPEPSDLKNTSTDVKSSESSSVALEGVFLIPSTQGFILSDKSSSLGKAAQQPASPWPCSLPGGFVSLQLN